MTVILDQFVQTLRECGLMTAEEIDSFVAGLPAEEKPQTGEDLAKLLNRYKKLTRFQIQAVYQGKTKGLVFGNYIVLDKIGQGGMGYVYKAQHRRMKRMVALKVLPSAVAKSPAAIKRFEREVEAAAKLSHPHIVTAYDADEADGIHFLVMEYVEGTDLANLVRRDGPLPVSRAIDYVLQAAQGLEFAHRHQVIHRDIKPSNLVLDGAGVVKILDMGLARFEREVEAATRSESLDRERPGDGHARLHGTGAGSGHTPRRRAGRHLQSGLHAVSSAHGPSSLRRRYADAEDPRTSRRTGTVAVVPAGQYSARAGRRVSADGGQAARGSLPINERGDC